MGRIRRDGLPMLASILGLYLLLSSFARAAEPAVEVAVGDETWSFTRKELLARPDAATIEVAKADPEPVDIVELMRLGLLGTVHHVGIGDDKVCRFLEHTVGLIGGGLPLDHSTGRILGSGGDPASSGIFVLAMPSLTATASAVGAASFMV